MADLEHIPQTPNDVSPPKFLPKTLYMWLLNLVVGYNALVDAVNATGTRLVGYPTPSSEGVKSDFAFRLDRVYWPGEYFTLPGNYVPGSTEFYWERRRLIRKTEQTEAAGKWDYYEAAGADGNYRRVWLDPLPMQKGSFIWILYTPAD